MDTNRKFIGVVNGKTYTSVEDYNKAFLYALGQNCGKDAVIARIELSPVNAVQEPYDHCLPDFDLDELTGVTETDAHIIDDFIKQDLSADRAKEILDRAHNMNTSDRADLDTDVKDMIESIRTDIEDNNHAHTTLLESMKRNEQETNKLSQEINQLRTKLDNLKKDKNKIQTQINITEGADRILRASFGFYKNLDKYLNRGQQTDDSDAKSDAKVTGRTVEKGNPGFILDHDQKEVARKLFQEIFGI